MPSFTYEAIDAKGNRIQANIEAGSQAEAISKIRAKGLRPTKISQAANPAPPSAPSTTTKAKVPIASPAPAMPAAPAIPVTKPKKRMAAIYIGGISRKKVVQFTGQFATLLEAGLTIVRSLKVLGNQQRPGPFQDTILSIADDVETGGTLSGAMAKHPKAFDSLYVNMIKAGEKSGKIDVILRRLADYMEKMQKLKQRVLSASVYPAIVMLAAIGAVTFIMMVIVPTFKKIFEQQQVQLPAVTSILINVSSFFASNILLLIGIPILLFILFKLWSMTKPGRMQIDTFKLHMPIFGTLVRKTITARFCRTLGTLLQSGVSILDAFLIVKGVTGNEVVSKAIEQVHAGLKEGESIAGPLSSGKVFDDMVINMIEVGEETGELDKMLIKIADTYDYEVDVAIAGLMSMLEPLLILFLGGVIGFIVISIFLPLVTLIQQLQARGA